MCLMTPRMCTVRQSGSRVYFASKIRARFKAHSFDLNDRFKASLLPCQSGNQAEIPFRSELGLQ